MAELSPITIARFWSKIQVGRDTDCWPWRGGEDYGRVKIDGKLYLPHRLAYEIVNGPIPEGAGYHGTVVRHRCDNPACCNPSHLLTGTQSQNMLDAVERGRLDFSKDCGRKLTQEQAAKIRSDPRSGRVIAAEYGIGKSQVQRIKSGERWKGLLTDDHP